MQRNKIGFSQFPFKISSIPLPSSTTIATSNSSLQQQQQISSLSLPNVSVNQKQSIVKLNNNLTPRKRKRQFLPCDGTKKLIPFTEVEWKYVQRKFMNEDHQTLMELTNIMNMWLCRMWHDTPVFISISELVLRALILDQKRHSSKGSIGLDNADIGLILGSVIIRFVNYVNEVCQPGMHKISIRNAVGKMDIPSWVVNIRHQATHGQMPPMNMLKEAIKFCRKWLWFQHWSKPLTDAIKQALPGSYEEQLQLLQSHLNNRMCKALQRFREWRRMNSSLTEFPLNNTNSPSSSGSSGSLRRLFESLLNSHEDFIPFFALTCLAQNSLEEDKMSINSEMAESEYDVFVVNGNIEENQILVGNLFSKQKYIGIVSAEEQYCYSPIFHLLNSKGLLHCLLLELTRLVSNECLLPTFSCRKHLAGWAEILLSAYLRTPTSISFHDWRTVLRHFVMAPQFFQDEQIKSLLLILNDGLSKKCKTRLLKLFNIREQTYNNNEEQNNNNNSLLIDQSSIFSIKTLGDLQNKIIQAEENPDCTFICDPLTMEDDWSLVSSNELGSTLGLTNEQSAETLCLALEFNFF